jgi:hypothetical protein
MLPKKIGLGKGAAKDRETSEDVWAKLCTMKMKKRVSGGAFF